MFRKYRLPYILRSPSAISRSSFRPCRYISHRRCPTQRTRPKGRRACEMIMIRSEISQARNSISYYLARFRVSILFDAFRVIFLILILFAHTHGCTSIRAQAQAHARTRLSSRLSNCPQSCCTADAADVVLVVCASEERRASTTKRVPHDSSALAPQTPPRAKPAPRGCLRRQT